MLLWLVFATLVFGAVVSICAPLFRSQSGATHSHDDVDVYAAQLGEIDRDQERGLLTAQEADETRAEVARRLLKARKDADHLGSSAGASWIGRNQGLVFGSIAGFMTLSSLGVYLALGTPGLPAYPLAARLEGPTESQSVDVLVAKVEKRLTENPEDAAGWTVLAPVYFKQGRFDRAAEAYQRSIRLAGATPEKLLGLGEALSYANNGIVSDGAAKAFTDALETDPASIRARFWLALRDEQNGNVEAAQRTYKALLNEQVPEAWKRILDMKVAALGSGDAQRAVPAPSGAAEPDASAQARNQPEAIRNMVEGLAGRLEQDGSDLKGWLMLLKSYAVLGEIEKARTAFASAKSNFKNQPDAIRQIEELARSLGLMT